ncbi:MAG: hypothetical protein DRN08_03285 [Thermoplasmata archaeon]|nr:MAG: hypothetical protein DRN05_03690 [Thermoplasmata archaeon]RLF35295.1 MAG: hypothetical protein DRN08_03285 [Thermoplasmata archaeon]
MRKTKEQLYELIEDLKTREEFEEEIKKRFLEYEKLLDEDIIALFIVDELGRNKQAICRICDLKPDMNCTLFGRVVSVSESRVFRRKNGSQGRVINLEICDDTGSCRLVLWNKDVEQIKDKNIKIGSVVKIVNGYTKKGFSGIEIHLGKWSLLEVNPKGASGFSTSSKVADSLSSEIIGFLTYVEPTHAFFRDDGSFGFVTNIGVKTADGKEKKLVLWGERVREIQSFKIGDMIRIKNVDIRWNGGEAEVHVNEDSIIQRG